MFLLHLSTDGLQSIMYDHLLIPLELIIIVSISSIVYMDFNV